MPTINGATPPPPPRPPKKSQPVKKVTQPTSASRGALDNPDIMDESGSGWRWSNPKTPLPPRVKEYIATFHTLSVVDEGPLPAVTRKIQQNPELYEALADVLAETPKAVSYMFSDQLTDDQQKRLLQLGSLTHTVASNVSGNANKTKQQQPKRATEEQIKEFAKYLEPYGIRIYATDAWFLDDLQEIQSAVTVAGNRLAQLAKTHYAGNAPSGPELFRRIFSDKNGFDFRYQEAPSLDNYSAENEVSYNAGEDSRAGQIKFFADKLADGKIKAERQSGLGDFKRSYTAEFLVLHEISHSVGSKNVVFLNAGKDPTSPSKRFKSGMPPLAIDQGDDRDLNLTYAQIIRKTISTQYGVAEDKIYEQTEATAGFQYVARSKLNEEEYIADAIANWLLDSFTDDEYGRLRRQQMDDIMMRLIFHEFGTSSGVLGY